MSAHLLIPVLVLINIAAQKSLTTAKMGFILNRIMHSSLEHIFFSGAKGCRLNPPVSVQQPSAKSSGVTKLQAIALINMDLV